MKSLNREILRLAIPSILANLTVPLVGMVDLAVAGHLPVSSGAGAAAFIGGISVGSLLFDLIYWNFFFMRASTGGLTAQAFGRGDMGECARILGRGMGISLGIAAVLLALQWPFVQLALLAVDCSDQVRELALRYFFIRVWAAPATMSLMALRGWFVGMQDSMSSMFTDLVVNGVNIAASVLLSLGVGGWDGLGFVGIAWGTVVAQYAGLGFALLVCVFKYGRRVFEGFSLKGCFRRGEMRGFVSLNADLMGRSLSFTAIYMGFTLIAARFGDTMLACATIMMKLLLIFSYFTDGFAYAGEALTGRFIGARDPDMLHRTICYVFYWSFGLGMVFMGLYWVGGLPMLRLLTDDGSVVEACRQFLPWLVLMPPVGCAAFAWDGIYIGATAAKAIRNAMFGAFLSFLAVWLAGRFLILRGVDTADTDRYNVLGIHVLLAAYFAHLAFRAVYLTVEYRRKSLSLS